ncbi:pyroglutamyl-peptidase I family protein [Xanthobacter agilis]|uniref:Pyrrolidone-carboxylate peptidase n=1 Tax=Xanthobacter agilis TaxID=47492 RepID=A0ABU0L9W7_XANAG|nr:peptidase C15 [Xanthobacter agilis]MDQ0503934.1 pyroglutamyl-peptidase [Xanthobacter agilis]
MAPRTRILVCAFGPFPGVPVNPSARLAQVLGRTRRPALGAIDLIVEILPTRWDALGRLVVLLERHAPDAVLLLGVAPRRSVLCVETRAVNAAADRPDVAYRHPRARRIDPDAPANLRTTARIAPLVAAARAAGAAARSSRDAGRYLCNASYFQALAWAAAHPAKPPPVVFVHVPGRQARPRREDPILARAVAALLVTLHTQSRRP